MAKLFLNHVFKLHGMPSTIVSDRDPLFISKFWQELFRLQGTALKYSSAYHPQTDGQSEVVNKCVENYLRCVVGDNPKEWVRWLPLTEWHYNTSFHFSTKTTPFKVVYGILSPRLLTCEPGTTAIAAVDEILRDRSSRLQLLLDNLHKAQD